MDNNRYRTRRNSARGADFRWGSFRTYSPTADICRNLPNSVRRRNPFLTRRNGLAFSLIWCLFFLLIMAPLWGILDIEKLAGASAIIGIFGGLIMLISSAIFLKKDVVRFDHYPQMMPPQQQYGLHGASQTALPPQQSVPASFYAQPQAGRWRETNDLEPSSVTESTTRLLNEQEGPK